MKTKGFTLLELLVVISIIGILVAIATVSFTTAQKQGRDSRRRGDIKAIQNAFEQYNAENAGAYADDCSTMLTGNLQGPVPTDPKTGGSYLTTATCSSVTGSYCLCALMEITGAGNSDSDCPATYASSGDELYWCATNLQ